MKKFRFNISMDADVTVEAQTPDDARKLVVELLDRGDYDHLLVPDASAYVDDGYEIEGKNNEP